MGCEEMHGRKFILVIPVGASGLTGGETEGQSEINQANSSEALLPQWTGKRR
jgi:hypothetical protein